MDQSHSGGVKKKLHRIGRENNETKKRTSRKSVRKRVEDPQEGFGRAGSGYGDSETMKGRYLRMNGGKKTNKRIQLGQIRGVGGERGNRGIPEDRNQKKGGVKIKVGGNSGKGGRLPGKSNFEKTKNLRLQRKKTGGGGSSYI